MPDYGNFVPVPGAGNLYKVSRPDLFFAGAGWKEWKKVPDLQVPQHVYGCGGGERRS